MRTSARRGARQDGRYANIKFEIFAVTFVNFCIFWILLLPKAGMRVGEIPFTVSSLCVLLLMAYLASRRKAPGDRSKIFLYLLFSCSWYFLAVFRNTDFQISLANKISAVSWFLLSPILWILASNFRLLTRAIKIDLIYLYFCFLSIYSICQFLFGLEFFQIPGITIALGDDYAGKNLSIFQGSNIVATKSPSTYQSGNLFGQTAALILIWIVELNSRLNYGSRRLRILMIISISVALLLSLSRTALLALMIGWLVHLVRSRSNKKAIFGLATVFVISLIFLEPIIANRFSLTNLTSDSGRTAVWSVAVETYSLTDWLFGRVGPSPRLNVIMEGILGLISQVGLLGLLFIIICWKKSGLMKLPGFTAVFWLCIGVDSTYFFPPFMWIPAIVLIVGNNVSPARLANSNHNP